MNPHLKELELEIRKLTTEYPKAIYSHILGSCCYNSGKVIDGPSSCGCIIGQAAQRLPDNNPLKKLFAEADTECAITASRVISWAITELACNFYNWFNLVQDAQDNGRTWEDAVALADKTYPS